MIIPLVDENVEDNIIIIQAMAPQSVMFPGLHPAAMMATVNFSINIIVTNII